MMLVKWVVVQIKGVNENSFHIYMKLLKNNKKVQTKIYSYVNIIILPVLAMFFLFCP